MFRPIFDGILKKNLSAGLLEIYLVCVLAARTFFLALWKALSKITS